MTAACVAEQGNEVWCVDVDAEKVQQLQNGQIPIFEPGLQDIVKRNAAEGNLHFTTDLVEGVRNSLFIFIAVGTPTLADGSSDLQYVFEVAIDANKVEIKKALEKVFKDIKVQRVNTLRQIGKIKTQGRTSGRTPEVKKAYVKLTEDSKPIEFFEGMV